MILPINLPMDLRDLGLWESGELTGFAIPLERLPEPHRPFDLPSGTEVNILEPFKRLTVQEEVEKNGKTATQKVTVGIVYRSDNKVIWDSKLPVPPEEYEEADRWSPARQLPDYAVRRKATVVKSECVPLQSFTKEQIKLLRLDYESQDNPQLLMEEFVPHKDFELLYQWWKQHYKSTLRDGDNPYAIILCLTPAE